MRARACSTDASSTRTARARSPRTSGTCARAPPSSFALAPPGDEVALLTFGDRLTFSVAPTTDLRAVTAALEAPVTTTAAVRSMVWDATLAGAAVAAGRSGQPLVVLLSDGTDNASWRSQDAAIASLRDLRVPVDLIAVPRTDDSDDPDPPSQCRDRGPHGWRAVRRPRRVDRGADPGPRFASACRVCRRTALIERAGSDRCNRACPNGRDVAGADPGAAGRAANRSAGRPPGFASKKQTGRPQDSATPSAVVRGRDSLRILAG
jgi:hypothetical protein